MMLGHSITSFNDPLQRISIKQLYHELVQGTEEQKVFCEQLKRIATIDKKSYQELKKKLPYIVCGLFHPPFRRKENFASIQFFIVDIDHLENHEQTAKELKNSLTKDDEVFMALSKKYGNPYEDAISNNAVFWVLDYENALKFHNERTEVIEGEFGD